MRFKVGQKIIDDTGQGTMCIDTRLFNDFFDHSNNFMDFLECIDKKYPNALKKENDKIVLCKEIGIVGVKTQCDIVCNGIIFEKKVNFYNCNFKGKVSFKNCTFEKQAIFSNSLFKNNVYFDNSTFKGYADFHESNFMSITSFYGVNFQKVPNFSACYFKEQKAVNLVNVDINNLDFRKVEKFIDDNYKDKTYDNDIIQNPNNPQEIEQKHRLRYAQNAKDSFRVVKDILIEQNNILEAQEWHKLELYAKEKELETISVKKYGDYATWFHCVLLQLYRNTSDHHTNIIKIFNFTVGMIALYAGLCFIFSKSIDTLTSINFLPTLFLSSYCVIIIILFLYWKTSKKFLMLSLAMIFIIFAFLFFGSITFLSPKSIIIFFLMYYFLPLLIFYILFICKIKYIALFINTFSYMVFLGVIVLKSQFINPFIGIFSNDKFFESKFEQKLSDLNSNTIINLAKISQKEFEFLLQEKYNISFAELNSLKATIIANKRELNNILSFLFDEKKISNFKEILVTLENNASNLPNAIKNIDDKNNNSAIFFDMRKLINLDFVKRADDIEYNIFRDFPLLSITPKNEEYQIFESQENQIKLKNILSIINLDNELELQSIKRAIGYDEILSDTIKSTSVIYSIILLLCIFSLQKTARKNSIIPS